MATPGDPVRRGNLYLGSCPEINCAFNAHPYPTLDLLWFKDHDFGASRVCQQLPIGAASSRLTQVLVLWLGYYDVNC